MLIISGIKNMEITTYRDGKEHYNLKPKRDEENVYLLSKLNYCTFTVSILHL